MNLKRVSITGPESTGKSWLARNLAERFNTLWVPEYSREYLAKLDRDYFFEDILEIAKGQLSKEKEIEKRASGLLFCDTDLLVTKIWSEFKYHVCDPWILAMVKIHRYDLYLLCDTDIPWEADPMREHPDKRQELLELYKKELEEMQVKWILISGTGQERLRNAIFAVEQTFASTNV